MAARIKCLSCLLLVLCEHSSAQSPIETILAAGDGVQASLISEAVESQYRFLRDKTVRVRIERKLYKAATSGPARPTARELERGMEPVIRTERTKESELTHTPTLVCSSRFGRVEGIVKNSGVRLIGTFDGSRGYKYRTRPNGGGAYQVDVVCSKPSFIGSFSIFLGITGTGDVFQFPGWYEMWSALEFGGAEVRADYGKVLVLKESKDLPNGRRSVRHYFGEVNGLLVYRGRDTVDAATGRNPRRRSTTVTSTYSIDYEPRGGNLFPASWTYLETKVAVDDANRAIGAPKLIEKSSSKVLELDLLDEFPLSELDVPLDKGAKIVDLCGPDARVIADFSEVGKPSSPKRRYTRHFVVGVLVLVVLCYVIWRKQAEQ